MIKKTIATTLLAATYAITIEPVEPLLDFAQVNTSNVHAEYDDLRANGSGTLNGMKAYVLTDNHVDYNNMVHPGEGWIVVHDARVADFGHLPKWYMNKCATVGNTGMMGNGKSLADLMWRVENKYPGQPTGPVDEFDALSINLHNKNTFKVNYKLCGGWEEVLERLTYKEGVDTYIFTKYIDKSPDRDYRTTRLHDVPEPYPLE